MASAAAAGIMSPKSREGRQAVYRLNAIPVTRGEVFLPSAGEGVGPESRARDRKLRRAAISLRLGRGKMVRPRAWVRKGGRVVCANPMSGNSPCLTTFPLFSFLWDEMKWCRLPIDTPGRAWIPQTCPSALAPDRDAGIPPLSRPTRSLQS